MANFDIYSNILHSLGFANYLHNNLKSQVEDEKKEDKKERSFKKLNLRGKLDSSSDKTFKKVEKELNNIKDSWKFLSKNKEFVNTYQILIFLTGILGLYEGEKPNINIVSTSNSKLKIEIIKKNEINKSNTLNETQIKNKFQNILKSKLLTKTNSKSPEKKILIKKIVPELDLNIYSYSFKAVQYLKYFFRYFCDNRTNYLHNMNKKSNVASQSDFNIKPKLNAKTLKSAENYRQKCFEVNMINK